MIAAPEGHRVEGKPPDRDLAAKMIGVRPYLTNVVDAHVTKKEVRPGIPGPARLERRELERELAREDLRCDLGVHADRRDGSLAVKPLAHDGVEALDEVVDAIDGNREPRGHRVAAVLDEDVVAVVERLGDMNTGDRAARALALVSVDGDHDRGPAIVLDEPRRAQPDDARGPLRVGDDRDPGVRTFLRALSSARDDLPCQLLPLGVALLEALGELLRLLGILREQEPKRFLGVVDPTRRIEAGTEHEADLSRTDMAELETGALDEGAHADEGRAVQGLQTHPGEHAIAPAKRDNIRDRRKRAELQQLVLPQAIREIAEQTLRKHEGHAGTRELLVDRRIAGTPWVDERVRVRELGRRVVMVGHDEIDAELARERRLFHRGNATVDADDHLRAVLRELPERRRVQAVALLVAIRYVRTDHEAKLPEGAHQDRRAGDPVDVVVPIDDDALASRERTTEPLDRAIQIEHRRAIFGRPRGEEGGHLGDGKAAAGEHLRHERGDTIRYIPGLLGHDPAPLRREGHLTFKYLAQVFTLVLAVTSCTPSATTPTPVPTQTGRPAETGRPAVAVPARFDATARRWYLVPDPRSASAATTRVVFDADPTATAPSVRLRSTGAEFPLAPTGSGNVYIASLDFHGLAPGRYFIDVVERLATTDFAVATKEIVISEPEYVVWTLDFEGDASSDQAMANTAAIADEQRIPMTIMWNPRVWTTAQVPPARADAMLAWTKDRVAKGDELSLHLHMWTDFVRAAGLVPRTAPSWAGRGDGYDVPITAYPENDQRALVEYSLRLMAEHGLARPTTFRAGGQFANEATLRTLAALGFAVDASAVPAGAFGRLPYPWTLAADAQPYRPSTADANAPGDLPLLEAPTIGGNTFGYDIRTIEPIIHADLSYLAPAGEIASTRRAITIVSHPGTIDATERAAITELFDALASLRYDLDNGPLRFVTLAQLAQAWR